MGLRDDFRGALDAIISSASDATHVMRHGEDEEGRVVQSSSRDFTDEVAGDAPAVASSVIANAAHFPTLERGSAVEIGGSLRVVVSLKEDAVGATFTAGLSAPFERTAATYSGRRRGATGARSLLLPIDVLYVENGVADGYSDASAPAYALSYTLAVRADDWPDETAPETADSVEIAPDGHSATLKVSSVERHDGWYILKCRTRG